MGNTDNILNAFQQRWLDWLQAFAQEHQMNFEFEAHSSFSEPETGLPIDTTVWIRVGEAEVTLREDEVEIGETVFDGLDAFDACAERMHVELRRENR